MKKCIFIIPLLLVASCSFGNQTESGKPSNSLETPTTLPPTSIPTTQPDDGIKVTLKELISAYKMMGNYTYTIVDEIFDVTSTLRYTPKAYYYEPDKAEHGGQAYGYAENSKGVFTYTFFYAIRRVARQRTTSPSYPINAL